MEAGPLNGDAQQTERGLMGKPRRSPVLRMEAAHAVICSSPALYPVCSAPADPRSMGMDGNGRAWPDGAPPSPAWLVYLANNTQRLHESPVNAACAVIAGRYYDAGD
ncbi:hypothetical protein PG985_006552 [Apiospora marii]|uniref:Uncharacterized protein n=1 Tax=Apiospora marii TaxID=335849 RepID=A0ABR1S9R3_9PEZI